MTPHHPPLPFHCTASSPRFLPKDSQPSTELASLGGDGGGRLRRPEAPPRRPQQRPSPLRDRRAAPGRESGGSLGGAQTNAAQSTALRAGEGGVSRLLFPGTFSLSGRSWRFQRTPRAPRLGEGARWQWVSDLSYLSNLTQKGNAEMYKVCLQKVVRDPNRGRLQEAAASSREKEGRGDRAGSGWWGCEGKVKRGGKGKGKRGREAASLAVPTPPLQGPREREGQRLRSGVRIQGRCVFGFTPRAPSGCLSPPPSPSPRPGGTN